MGSQYDLKWAGTEVARLVLLQLQAVILYLTHFNM